MTAMVTEPQSIVFEELDEDMTPPCELGAYSPVNCGPAPAKWVMHLRCPECGASGIRLACDACKEVRLTAGPECSIECPNGDFISPPREAYHLIEAL